MKLPASFTQVTPLSKYISLGFLIVFPVVGFLIGMRYQKMTEQKTVYIENVKLVKVASDNSPEDLKMRCGELPKVEDLIGEEVNLEGLISGPIWSIDCRKIVWAINNQKTNEANKISNSGDELKPGIYVVNETGEDKKIIYTALDNEVLVVGKWQDTKNLIFYKNYEKQEFYLDIISGEVSEEENN